MKYTLDSIKQYTESLQAENKDATIRYVPVFWTGDKLLQLIENPKMAFFGVLTLASGNNGKLSYRGDEIITVEPSSQIIEAFSACDIVDDADLPVPSPKGSFRGFQISIS